MPLQASAARAELDIDVHVAEATGADVSPDVGLCMYRVAQEALGVAAGPFFVQNIIKRLRKKELDIHDSRMDL